MGPGPVASLRAAQTGTRARINWAEPADTGEGEITGYEYRQSADGAAWENWTSTGENKPGFELTLGNRSYYIQVRAVTGAAHSRGPAEEVGPPDAPRNLSLTRGNQRIDATWEAEPADDGGSAILSYRVEYSKGPNVWVDANVSITGLMAAITGLENDEDYSVRAAARNILGFGPYTDPVMAMTASAGTDRIRRTSPT